MDEKGSEEKLSISVHPLGLEPSQGIALHVKGWHAKSLIFRSTVEVEELGDLEYPSQ